MDRAYTLRFLATGERLSLAGEEGEAAEMPDFERDVNRRLDAEFDRISAETGKTREEVMAAAVSVLMKGRHPPRKGEEQ